MLPPPSGSGVRGLRVTKVAVRFAGGCGRVQNGVDSSAVDRMGEFPEMPQDAGIITKKRNKYIYIYIYIY